MRSRSALFVAVLALLAGCSRHLTDALVPNQRPQLEVLDARADRANPAGVRVRWAARDPDGTVSRVLYTLAPMRATLQPAMPSATTASEVVLPRAVRPLRLSAGEQRPQPDLLTLWAVDDRGAESDHKTLAMFDNNIAPTVTITCPIPNALYTLPTSSTVNFGWAGIDPDGIHTQHPVQYKYKLLPHGNPEFDIDYARLDPDSLRRYYAANNWAGWDSTGGDTTTLTYTGLTPGQTYLFVITAFDEVGDYDPVFNFNKNMITFSVVTGSTLGPRLTMWNSEFFYSYPTGGWSTDPSRIVTVEEPAGQALTFNLSALPPLGGAMAGYRWELDATNPADPTVRSDPADLAHWSPWSTGAQAQVQVGPFSSVGPKRESHTLYVEGSSLPAGCGGDPGTGVASLGIIHFIVVRGTYSNELLIVDDTRLETDQFVGGVRKPYGQIWPSRAELDTFLFARGGYPWTEAIYGPAGTLSPPGLFAGYAFDTIGTRGQISGGRVNGVATGSLPLSTLSEYRHVIWMVDHNGGYYTAAQTNALQPMSALHYMNTPGHENVFSEYIALGGRVWLMGGAAAVASLREFNAVGADNNDRDYAPINGFVFAGAGYAHHEGKEELTVGRLMYDDAQWRSLMISHVTTPRINRSASATAAPALWADQPGWQYANPVHRPDYTLLPAQMHIHSNPASDPVNGEPIPPTRSASYSSVWWSFSPTKDVEYLLQPNIIVEDMNPDPAVDAYQTALDTLMSAQGTGLVAGGTGYEPATMTWYHGVNVPEFVFSGFPVWDWRRSDCQQLVDFVLQQIWHLNKSATPVAAHRPGMVPSRSTPTATEPVGRSRAPAWRSGVR